MLFSCYRWANGGTERWNNLPYFTQIVSYEVGISTQMWPGPVIQSCSIPQRPKGYKFFWSWSLTHCFLTPFWDGSWRHLPFCFTCWKPSSLASSFCLLALPLIESPRTTPQPTESESWLWQFDFFFKEHPQVILMSSHLRITGNYFFHHGLCLCPEGRINRIILPFCFTEAVWISKSAILPNIQVTKYLPCREWSCVMPVLTSGLLGLNHTYSVIVSKINPQTFVNLQILWDHNGSLPIALSPFPHTHKRSTWS